LKHRYDDLLRLIIRTIKNDYAGFPEKMERHDSRYYVNTTGTAFKQGKLDELLFLRIVSQYLASLGDPNLKFSMVDHEDYRNYSVGFRVRRFADDLYVTECAQDERLKAGDRLISVNHLPAGMHRAKFRKNILIGNTAEREQWGGFLKMADHFVVEHPDGTREDLPFAHFELQQPEHRVRFWKPSSDVCCLSVEEFSQDTAALETLLNAHEAELRICSSLVIDLRKNEGGTESGFEPLLPLVMEHPLPRTELPEEPVYMNYTKENCDRRVREFQVLKNMYEKEADEGAARMCGDLIREYIEKAGSGLTREYTEKAGSGLTREYTEKAGSGLRLESEEADFWPGAGSKEAGGCQAEPLLQPYENIKKVILITDTWCRDAGEVFVKMAADFSKVTVLGRPTMGTIDYTNSVTMVLDQTFVLSYPMGKRGYVMDGTRYNETGLPVDIYVPWTPRECTEDVLLEKALEILS